MLSKALLSASSFGVLSEMLTIAAMTSLGGSVWIEHSDERKRLEMTRRKFAAEEGDHLTLLNVYQAFITTGKKDVKFCRDNSLNFKSMTRAVSVRGQLKRMLERFGLSVDETLSKNANKQALGAGAGGLDKGEAIRRCLTTGFFAHAAKMQPDGTFRNVAGGTVLHAHPSSLMFNRKAGWVVFQEVMEVGEKTYVKEVTKIEKDWLVEYAPEFYKAK
jgi:ATP-dependent RNA helicase DDX35